MKILFGLYLIVIFSCSKQSIRFEVNSLKSIIEADYDNKYPRWSPDNQQLLFESNQAGHWDIFLLNIESKVVKRLTTDTAADRSPSWSPDGKSFVFQSMRNGQDDLFIYHFNDGSIVQLTKSIASEMNPDWSPDGNSIVYAIRDSSSIQIELLNIEMQTVTRVSNEKYRSLWPRWSSDGTQLVFFSRRDTEDKDDELYIYNMMTQLTRRLTNIEGHDFTPTFTHNNKHIIAASVRGQERIMTLFDLDGQSLDSLKMNDFIRIHSPDWSNQRNDIVFTAKKKNAFYNIYQVRLVEL